MRGHISSHGSAWELRADVGAVSGKHKDVTRSFRRGNARPRRHSPAWSPRLAPATVQHTMQRSRSDRPVARARRGRALALDVTRRPPHVSSSILPALGIVPLLRACAPPSSTASAQTWAAAEERLHRRSRRHGPPDPRDSSVRPPPGDDALEMDLHESGGPRLTPAHPRQQITPPAPADGIRLIERAEVDHPELGCFLLLASRRHTGARRGELCALHWQDVNPAGRCREVCTRGEISSGTPSDGGRVARSSRSRRILRCQRAATSDPRGGINHPCSAAPILRQTARRRRKRGAGTAVDANEVRALAAASSSGSKSATRRLSSRPTRGSEY